MKNIFYAFHYHFNFQSGCTEAHIVDTQRMIHVGGFDITKTKISRNNFISGLHKRRTI